MIASAVVAALVPLGPPIEGRAYVVDGDTLRIGTARVRLLGLDAPEIDQMCLDPAGAEWSCGRDARDFLVSLTRGNIVSCVRRSRDIYGRWLARCSADGVDLGGAIVAAGWATAEFEYVTLELGARGRGLGVWRGTFMPPAEWRRSHGSGAEGPWDWLKAWLN